MKVGIVGSGVIGLCSAYYLTKAGHQVTLFDKQDEHDQTGCSFINCGYLTPSHFIPLAAPGVVRQGLRWMMDSSSPLYIKPRFDRDLARWMLAFYRSANQTNVDLNQSLLLDLNLRSRDLYHSIAREESLDFGYVQKGLIIACQTEEALHEEKHVADRANRLGLKARALDYAALTELEPEAKLEAVGGVYYPEDGQIMPVMFMQQMKKWLANAGAKFIYGRRVEEVTASGEIVVSNERFVADTVVIASGSWASQLTKSLGIKLPLQAGKGYSTDLDMPQNTIHHPIILAEQKIAITPFGDNLRVGGTMEIAGLDETINTKRTKAILDGYHAFFPENENGQSPSFGKGFRPVSPDGMPYVGRLTQHPKVIVATGHAMMGMSMGPITGEMVSKLVANEKIVNQHLIDPERFG